MKKLIALLLALVMVFALVACASETKTNTDSSADTSTDADTTTDTADTDADADTDAETATEKTAADLYIPVMAKGFQHQYWQAVYNGATAAAEELGCEIYFDGPASETEIDAQVNMIKNEMAKNPDAMALAALSTDAVKETLAECAEKGIPVIGFDSGVPDDTSGAVKATAATNNEAAAALAAEKFGEHPDLVAAMEAATPENPEIGRAHV